ncbi:MAG: hypothetical protein COY58_01785 [Gammaproteobacteria bacterium CG_4_10_14_0_8_um_filter_38_16]|nr:MAG: hypothetical protein COY58_01785 [Gammaproteobacteria bacterium CG_4_10_14_0_8_um_filter_38_16]PJA03330.1 MAG: hypothetical protein COX72_05750 [Gammaproteobacteria bacterium CG_4_10_14_0_2_um_filter_38_22]PJB10748.1 MAG: hypothetical protein CO120_03230 [Gammaproteobacteria bacterium CG_4_9_14_3_um_filter_38_9]
MGVHVTKGDRAAYVDAFKRSGLTQSAFCEQLKINSKTFSYWIKIEQDKIDDALKNTSIGALNVTAQPDFIPIKVSDSADCFLSDDGAFSQASSIPEAKASNVISLRIQGFCVDIPMDFGSKTTMTGVKSLIQILHHLPSKQSL